MILNFSVKKENPHAPLFPRTYENCMYNKKSHFPCNLCCKEQARKHGGKLLVFGTWLLSLHSDLAFVKT